jgi:hypothetical protein
MAYTLEQALERELEIGLGREFEGLAEWEKSPSCVDNIPKLDPVKPKALTLGRILCPNAASAFKTLSGVVSRAVKMMDITMGELTRARTAFCRGEFMVGPSDLTRCWPKFRLGVCLDNPAVWSKGSIRKSQNEPVTVAEVIRRLVRPRNLIANNEISYVCEATCDAGTNAFTFPNPHGVCLKTPDRVIHLCPPFWTVKHAPYREQTIIHELVHLAHCANEGGEDTSTAVSIGSPECLAQFVVAVNGRELDPDFVTRCGFTTRCGPYPKPCPCCGKTARATTLPDWRPRR